MELEHVRVFDELQDGDLPLHLRGQGHKRRGQRDLPTSAPKGTPATNTYLCTHTHTCTHLHQHRLRQLLSVHDLDGDLLTSDAVYPKFNQPWRLNLK